MNTMLFEALATSFLVVTIPSSDRELPPPSPIVFQYDAAGNRISRSSSLSDLPEDVTPVQGESSTQEDGGQENE